MMVLGDGEEEAESHLGDQKDNFSNILVFCWQWSGPVDIK